MVVYAVFYLFYKNIIRHGIDIGWGRGRRHFGRPGRAPGPVIPALHERRLDADKGVGAQLNVIIIA